MTTQEQLDDRYGRTRSRVRRRWLWIGVGVFAVLAVVLYSWIVVASSIDTVRADDVAMEVLDERTVEIAFQVSGGTGQEIACALEALDEDFGIVGWRVLIIPASEDHTRVFRVTVPTLSLATTGLVNSCWVA